MGPGVSANPNLSAVIEEDMSEANESLIQKDFVDAPVRRHPLHYHLELQANPKKIAQKNRCYF